MKNSKFTKIKRKLKSIISRPIVIFSGIIAIVIFALMILLYFSEKGKNPDINNFFDVFWYTLVTITTVGYGDITPSSIIGRFIGLMLLLFGVVAFAAISGKIASVLFDIQLKKDRGLIKLKNKKGHFIICGWKPDFENILKGIILANKDISLDMIVLINSAPEEKMEKIKSSLKFKGINYLRGDYSDEATLLRANVKDAERILILADYSEDFSQLEIDSKTVMTILTVNNLNPKIYSAAEILDSKFEKHLSLAKCDEIILTRDYERSVLVSASSGKGISHILKKLISEDSKEGLQINDIEEKFVGKSYKEYKEDVQQNKTKSLLIGILENTGNFYSRRREALLEAQKNPNIQGIVDNLKKIKFLESNNPVLLPDDDYIIPQNSKGIFISSSRE